MIFSKSVKVKWNAKNKKYYESKKYIFTKMNDEVEISIDDLPNNSHVFVEFICDYCGEKYSQKWVYYNRNKQRSNTINKHSCDNCIPLKIKESNLINYNVTSVRHIQEINEKINEYICENNIEIQEKSKRAIFEKYGVKNVFELESIKNKIKQSNVNLYGVEYTSQRYDVISKIQKTKLSRYGKGKNNILFVNRRRENHWNWKGGASEENHILRTSEEYKTWRREVFEYDNYACRCCGKENNINAHHINDWKTYPELRFDVDNGIVLCVNCHRKFHSLYKPPNNLEQIKDFINKEKNIC